MYWKIIKSHMCSPAMKGSESKVRLDERVAAITGANTGIGFETAQDLYKRGAKVIMLCRNKERADVAAEAIRSKDSQGGSVVVESCDLSSLNSVRECARRLNESEEKIDILVNNAGVYPATRNMTEDGFELTWQSNHLGHFLLTESLLPLLKKSASTGFRPRIVNVSAMGHQFGQMNWDDLNHEQGWTSTKAYCQTKLANVLYCKDLAKRLEADGISAYCMHPGVVYTEIGRNLDSWTNNSMTRAMGRAMFWSPLQGAQSTIYCCVEESLKDKSGSYFYNCKEEAADSKAMSEEDQQKLREVSMKLVGMS